jgi:rhodanese-related sulfurtransferase
MKFKKMKKIKGIGFIFIFILGLMVLVVLRAANRNLFKRDANVAVEAAKSNRVLQSEYEANKNRYFIIDFRSEEIFRANPYQNSVHIPFQNLLDEENLESIKKVKTEILLVASDPGISAKAWVILNQLSFDNVYLLSETEGEVLKYRFQPDTMVRLE